MTGEWEDLSDDELLARLIQRGAHPQMAAAFVIGRDDPEVAEHIEANLR